MSVTHCVQGPTCGIKRRDRRTLGGMVRSYIFHERPRAQAELKSFQREPSFENAIERAAVAIDDRQKRYGHQTRLSASSLSKGKTVLLEAAKELGACDSFDELHELLKECLNGIDGLGELYHYDTALRIGASRGVMPERVYLHRGTRDGARALGLNWRADSLDPRLLPKELAVLEPYEMEDFLCIYRPWLRLDMTCAGK
jgi:hypothetical protein